MLFKPLNSFTFASYSPSNRQSLLAHHHTFLYLGISMWFVPPKGGVEYVNTCMQELFIMYKHRQGRTVQNGGSNLPNPHGQITPCSPCSLNVSYSLKFCNRFSVFAAPALWNGFQKISVSLVILRYSPIISSLLRLHSPLLFSTHDWRPNSSSLYYPDSTPVPPCVHRLRCVLGLTSLDFDLAPKRLLRTWLI